MGWYKSRIFLLTIVSVLLLAVIAAACAPAPPPPPPPPPPAPPAGTLEVNPPAISYALLEKSWPVVAKVMGLPEATATKMLACMAIMGIPIVFEGTGWKPGDIVSIDLVLPPDVRRIGMRPDEDSVGLGFTTVDATGKFMITMDSSAKLNWLLGGGISSELKADFSKLKPLPNGTYTIKASGVDARTATMAKWALEMVKPATQ